MMFMLLTLASQAWAQCANSANPIVAENCLTGSPDSEWDVKNGYAGDPSIQGFATDISVNRGSTIYFKIDTSAGAYAIDIYRMGYYGGMGARRVTSIKPSATLPQTQPPCATDGTVGLMDCGTWAISASWPVPATATSGIYFAHLIRTDTGADSHIIFIVRDDSSHSSILFQTADESWQAYNYYGSGSVYSQGTPIWDLANRSNKVSYNRPFYTRNFQQESDTFVFGPEFAMVQWLEQNGYDVTYFTGIDAARFGSLIKNHKIYMDTGHDEYWSGPQRANVEAARDAGVNLALFGGNQIFWKTRWENSIDGLSTPNRTLVCYKETLAFAKIDPTSTWTGTWRDPSFSPPSDGGRPENSLQGTLFMVNGISQDNDGSMQIQVPAADGKMRFWRNTAAASLSAGQTYNLPIGSLGYEWDEDVDNGYRPAGLFRLSTSTHTLASDLLLDQGATYGAGIATHSMTMYRAPSGALVFSAGSIDWSWTLNKNHDNPFTFSTPDPDPVAQQATVNLFADMGVQPATLQSNLSLATASTDITSPITTITYPASGSTFNTGSAVTVTGTASDSGGAVAGIEISGDGGTTWHPATGRTSWTYTWMPSETGAATLMVRAVDDSGNLEIAHGITLAVIPQQCPCNIWRTPVTPQTIDSGDGNSVEVGVKFRTDTDGSILGVRFYKAATNVGTHIGHLWSSTGTLLGTANFTGETSSGWQQANFTSPIPVTANTTYIVSYLAPSGHYSVDSDFFQAGVDNPPLHALADGADGLNGLFTYTSIGDFPTSSYHASNYWVDVVYTSSNTYNITGQLQGVGGAGATVSLSGTQTATTTADASGNYNFAGLLNGTYTVTPSSAGITFTPASAQITINYASAPGINFTSVVTNPQTISGTISDAPGAGATVNLTGAATATTSADSSGHYSFTGLVNATYNVAPSAPGVIFTPGVKSVTLSGAGSSGVDFQSQICNCISIWPASTIPSLVDSNDGTPVELGVKFTSSVSGILYGLRFYKAAANTGTHIGDLWSSTGTLLATATFTGETASGWQQVIFSTPVTITPNTTYIASYYAPAGHYSADTNYFASGGTTNSSLQALADSSSSNGVYVYSQTPGVFPSNSYSATNYWVDVIFSTDQSYSINGTVSGPGGAGATVTLSSGSGTVTATADALGHYSFNAVGAGAYSIAPANTNAAFTPAAQSITVSTADIAGVNFTGSSLCPCVSIWQPSSVPAIVDSGDGNPVETGVRFQSDYDGYILGIRFYKASTNTGSHIANLWSTDGTGSLLATGTFDAESNSGWQQITFANPVPVSANTSYVASYFAPHGHYSTTNLLFDTGGVDTPPLHALANTSSQPNGLFSYNASSTYPTSGYNASSYWVDVVYARATTNFSLSGTITGTGGVGVNLIIIGPGGTKTTIADSGGKYRFDGLAAGTYTITPSSTGSQIFNPASQSVTIASSHVFGVDFAISQPTYSISGTVTGAAGDTIALSGAATATTIADSSGNYTFTGLLNGTYTVTPGTVGYVISPANQSVTINGANVSSINFTGSSLNYSISGVITGGAGATVTLAGTSSETTVADGSGNYSFAGLINGSYTVTPAQVRKIFTPASAAVAVIGASMSNANFTVPVNCPCDTIWQPSATPTILDPGDTHPTEVGVTFRADADGYITGVRFYKGSANTGTHKGNLWSSTGALLGTADFAAETASGWQQVLFNQSIPVTANTSYVASYFAPAGHYSGDSQYFATNGIDTPPLHALQDGVSGPNGIYIYSPSSAFPTATYNAANYWVDVIYTPTATYSITGTITGSGAAGATVNLAGSATATTVSDSAGNFSFAGLTNGTYTINVAASPGFTYSPATRSVTIQNGHALGTSFSSQVSYSISGAISGPGGSGATVSLTGPQTATITANSSGVYSFVGLANGTYTVTPSKTGYIFTPPNQSVTISSANTTASFSSAATYMISGTISGAGGANATVQLTGASTATATANGSGVYSFTGVANGTYTVTPTKTGYIFTPANRSVTVSGANATASFSSATTYTISGTISGAGGANATLQLTGSSAATVTANASGAFSFTGLPNGAYSITPSKAGYTFTPTVRNITVNGLNVTTSFSSTVTTYTISGTISGAGGANATVQLTGASTATVTANASGAYSFTGVANGAYTVTPIKTDYAFTPANRSVAVNGANATASFTSAATHSISGSITGVGGPSATVTLTGPVTTTVTANTSGAFTFTGLPGGTYTVTPSKTGRTFIPSSRSVTVNTSNVTGVSFASL